MGATVVGGNWTGVCLRPRTVSARRATQSIIDSGAWIVALTSCALLRLGPEGLHPRRLIVLLPVVVIAQAVAGHTSGLYRGRWIFGSFEEVAALGRSVVVAGLALLALSLAITRNRALPVSAVIAGTMTAFLLMGAARYWWRMVYERGLRPTFVGRTRVIVFGAGDGGQRAIRAMLRDADSSYVPVALLDDDPHVLGMTFMGVRVEGDRTTMAAVARQHLAQTILVALPSATGPTVRELSHLALRSGLSVRVLPSVQELLDGEVRVTDIRKPNERDFLGRHHVDTDLEAVATYLRGKRVAVTGAGGSIGSELCRQIMAFEPAELVMIDRDESALHSVQLSIEGRALLDTENVMLLDIRDRERVKRLFCERRPEIVFHAAALKHLSLLEQYPAEALKTNVWGTLAVLEASMAAGVERFVNISTDKAANPCSVLGYSKRVAEGLTAGIDRAAPGRYLSVRFGNVLGSRGSVLTAFRSQLENGGPLTVTHPDATRFFMTVEEAVQLVIHAGAIGDGGEVLVLDMGDPVHINDVAEQMAQTVEPTCPIVYTGLRPGEKLHEELFGEDEIAQPSPHPLIRSVTAPPLIGDEVRFFEATMNSDDAVDILMNTCMAMTGNRYSPGAGAESTLPAATCSLARDAGTSHAVARRSTTRPTCLHTTLE